MTITVDNATWFRDWVEELAKNPPKTKGALNRTRRSSGGSPVGRCCIGVLLDNIGIPHQPSLNHEEAYFRSLTGMPDTSWSTALLGLDADSLHHEDEQWVLDVEGSPLWIDREEYAMDFGLATINDDWDLTHAQHADLLRYFGVFGDPEKSEVRAA